MTVPRARQLTAGVAVHIVLKADQPTGKLTTGTVQDILTRGDHPRGVKVRLTDGRVGRVQALAMGSTEPSCAESITDVPTEARVRGSGHRHSLQQDYRQDGGMYSGPESLGLDAYIVAGRKRGGKGRRGGRSITVDTRESVARGDTEEESDVSGVLTSAATAITTCPVCQDFEGDEAAVAHHVAAHFGD